jgi:4-hydroxymandelate oxidase
MAKPLNLDEFEALARETLPGMTYDFIAGGAEDERSVAGNRAAFVRRAGHQAIALTVDVPLLGRRERDLRNVFTLPDGVGMAHAYEPAWTPPGDDRSRSWASPIASANLTWDDLHWIRAAAGDLPLLLKGIVRGDDARRAVDLGVDGIWVSNHGGRQLDGAIATLDALTDVVAAVGGRCPIVLDGGVRRGTDVIKALALGADAVAIGRPSLYGLAAGGVQRVVELLRAELDLAMALVGAPSVAQLTPDLIA